MTQYISKVRLESYSLISSIISKIIVALGIVTLFTYCAFQANFFPTGLSVGDTLLFLFIALGFGIFYLYWLGLGYVICYFSVYPFKQNMCESESKCRFLSLLFVPIFGMLLYIISSLSGNAISMIAPIMSAAVIIIVMYFWKELPIEASDIEKEKRAQAKKIFIFIAVFFIPFIDGKAINLFVGSSVKILGISNNHASLVVNEKSLKIIQSVAAEYKIPVMGCQVEDTNLTVLHNFRIWWHGMGERSLVEILEPTESGWQGVAKIELNNKDINVVTYNGSPLEKNGFDTCFSFESDALFDFYSSEPNSLGVKRINSLLENIKNYLTKGKLEVESVNIIGHTDLLPVKSDEDSNLKLSERRAKAVWTILTPLLSEVPKEQVDIYGVGSLEPIKLCDSELSGDSLKECLAPNRRVEVKLRLIQKKEN